MKAKINRTYRFESCHQLRSLPLSHKCSRMHGHTYRIDVQLEGETDEKGMVLDFAGMDLVVDCFLKILDHQVLNHIPGLEQDPTAENISGWLVDKLKPNFSHQVTVRVWENPEMWAEVSG